MKKYAFITDSASREYCQEIIQVMVAEVGISEDEAVGRMNLHWKNRVILEDSLIFHELPEFWAYTIYYGHDSMWWMKPDGLQPLPYP